MRINPLTYGTDALRMLLYPDAPAANLPLTTNLIVLAVFALVMFSLCFLVVNRRKTTVA
jgi:ABC-type multidrug transport system permease subunit